MMCLQLANQIGLFFSFHAPIGLFHHSAPSSCPSCVLVGVLTRERVSGACFGSVFRERVSGASSLMCTGLKYMFVTLVLAFVSSLLHRILILSSCGI